VAAAAFAATAIDNDHLAEEDEEVISALALAEVVGGGRGGGRGSGGDGVQGKNLKRKEGPSVSTCTVIGQVLVNHFPRKKYVGACIFVNWPSIESKWCGIAHLLVTCVFIAFAVGCKQKLSRLLNRVTMYTIKNNLKFVMPSDDAAIHCGGIRVQVQCRSSLIKLFIGTGNHSP
jgi:hypothetical protein